MPPHYCRPSQNVAQYATWTVTAGTADANYPVTRLGNLNPSDPAKSTGTTLTVQAVIGWAAPIHVVQFLMHNLGGRPITITNNAGLNTTLTPAANYGDGFPQFAWKDLRPSAQKTATTWTFAMSVAAGVVTVGEIVLWQECLFLPLKWGVTHGPNRLAHKNVTDWGYEHYYDRGIRERTISGQLIDGAYRPRMEELEADAHGCVRQFPMILDEETQESYWVRFQKDDLDIQRLNPTAADIKFAVAETGLGLAP